METRISSVVSIEFGSGTLGRRRKAGRVADVWARAVSKRERGVGAPCSAWAAASWAEAGNQGRARGGEGMLGRGRGRKLGRAAAAALAFLFFFFFFVF